MLPESATQFHSATKVIIYFLQVACILVGWGEGWKVWKIWGRWATFLENSPYHDFRNANSHHLGECHEKKKCVYVSHIFWLNTVVFHTSDFLIMSCMGQISITQTSIKQGSLVPCLYNEERLEKISPKCQ